MSPAVDDASEGQRARVGNPELGEPLHGAGTEEARDDGPCVVHACRVPRSLFCGLSRGRKRIRDFFGIGLEGEGEPVAHFRGACQDFSEIPVDEAGQSLAADTGSRGLVPLHFNGVGSGPGERPVVGARHEPALPSGVIPERGERLLRRLVPGDGGP